MKKESKRYTEITVRRVKDPNKFVVAFFIEGNKAPLRFITIYKKKLFSGNDRATVIKADSRWQEDIWSIEGNDSLALRKKIREFIFQLRNSNKEICRAKIRGILQEQKTMIKEGGWVEEDYLVFPDCLCAVRLFFML